MHDAQLTNYVASNLISSKTVAGMTEKWNTALDSWTVGAPVYADVLFGDFERPLVFVGTEGGSLYAIDSSNGTVVWRDAFGTQDTYNGSCGTWGIASTPVIDKQRNTIYAVNADGKLHALDLNTGLEQPGFPATITENPLFEYVWGGLRILSNRIYVEVASYCDQIGPDGYAGDGRVVALNLDDQSDQLTWDTVSGSGTLGGVWSYGGMSVEPDGSYVYTGVGNSVAQDANGNTVDNVGYGDQMVKLTPDLTVVDSNNPGVPTTGDEDFGASPVLFQPKGCPPLAAANNKAGVLYVWARNNLSAGPIFKLGLSDGDPPFVAEPSWNAQLSMLYDHNVIFRDTADTKIGDGVAAISVDKGCSFHGRWKTRTGEGSQTPPLLVNDVVFANGGSETGGISALDAVTGRVLWSVDTGKNATMSPMIEARGTLYAVDGTSLRAYTIPLRWGQRCERAVPCAA